MERFAEIFKYFSPEEWEYKEGALSSYCDNHHTVYYFVMDLRSYADGSIVYLVVGYDDKLYGAFLTFEEADKLAEDLAKAASYDIPPSQHF